MTKQRFETLDLMRGIAALLVFFLHYRFIVSETYSAPNAGLAVDIFFVLSGFVISYTFDPRIENGLTVFAFTAARLWRLQPVILIGLLIGSGVLLIQSITGARPDYSVHGVLLATLFNAINIPYKLGNSIYGFAANSAQWSLFFELIVNIIFVVFWRRLTAVVLKTIIALSAFGLVALAIYYGSTMKGSHFDEVPSGLVRTMFSFFVGVYLSRTRDRWSAHIPCLPMLVLGIIVTVVLGAPAMGAFELPYGLAAQLIFSPLIVMFGAVSEPTSERQLASARFLGAISFPLYATHIPLRDWAIPVATKLGIPQIAVPIIMLPVSMGFAWILAEFFDPWVKDLRKILSRQTVSGQGARTN